MIDHGKQNILGIGVSAVDYEAAVAAIIAAAAERRPMAVSALAVHGVMTGVLDAEQRYRLNHLDLVVPDGQPVRWALNLLHGAALPDRVYGPTLTLKLCAEAARRELPIFLYGSRPEVLQALQTNLCARFPGLRIAGVQPSRFRQIDAAERAATVAAIQASGAALVFVGLGCPRQEVWAYEYRDLLAMPLIAVGAAFDFHAGLLAQAPPRLQRFGLEWAYRLLKEPRRLWRRYVLLNPLYLALLVLQLFRLKRFSPATARKPDRDLGYG
jgi:exopolysaccharide biosynthesis WecB/TagA/CpsF family protein